MEHGASCGSGCTKYDEVVVILGQPVATESILSYADRPFPPFCGLYCCLSLTIATFWHNPFHSRGTSL